MKEIEKNRTQRDAKRTVAGRKAPATSSGTEAILRHLGVEAYRDRKRAANQKPEPPEPAGETSSR